MDNASAPLSVTGYEAIGNKIMPELGQEIEDFNFNTWHITNWSHLKNRLTGPEFIVGGWKWRILLFPYGNNNPDFVSIYLDFADPKGAPEDWHVCVQFALVLWNPEDPTQFVVHHAHNRFNSEVPDWGFTRFYESRKLLIPSDKRTRALIENDSTNITAFVRVLKDPTGVLWHDFINYDSKKVTGYVGLKDQGSYMNSLLQLLYCTTYFRKAIYQIPTEDDDPIKSIPLALQRVFYQLQTSDTPVETTELTKSFGWDSLDCLIQHDVQEFNRVLQGILEEKMKGTKADGAIAKLFAGKMKSYIKCVNVDYESSRVEDYYDIQLNVKGCETLRDSFKEFIQEETLEGDNKYQARGYGLQDAKKGIKFESFPPVLHLHLKRFEYNIQRGTMVKINDHYEFPMEIDLEEFLSEDADKSKSHKYLLHGVFVHKGDLYGGHYFALLKPEKGGEWLSFNDNRVIPVIEREVLEFNYGGELRHIFAIRSNGRGVKRYTNAYMLVYIRESDIDEILSPVTPEDVPEHLHRRLEEDKALIEQRKREMEEKSLENEKALAEQITVKVVTAEEFKSHQGFDLVNFEDRQYPLSDILTHEIPKSLTYGTFKENISQIFNVPPERVRLWVFANRQNKTIRPDAAIPDSFSHTSMEEVNAKLVSRRNSLKLYMEIADSSINDNTWFPPTEENNHAIVFLKYFDPDKQTLEGLGSLYVQMSDKVGDYTHIFCKKKNFSPDTPLEIYEEVKPNMIIEMRLKNTFQLSEIQDGDIICFQKVLTEEEIEEHTAAGRIYTIPQFYESLALSIVVSFKPRLSKDRDSKPEFDLILNRKWTYEQVAETVALHLNTDPLKLRFTTARSPSITPKNVIKRNTNSTLSEMLQTTYLIPQYVLFYEMLDISIIDIETKSIFKVTWLGNAVKEKEIMNIVLQKNAFVNDIIEEILKRVFLPSPNSKIRLYEVLNHKIQKEYTGLESIDEIHDFMKLYAEEIPQDELLADPNDRIIQVFRFAEEPLSRHGIPFKFVIKNGETLADTKVRLQLRIGMSEKDFLKIRIAIISGTLCAITEYLEDDGIILSERKLSKRDYLGLDYVYKFCEEMVRTVEKAIIIREQ